MNSRTPLSQRLGLPSRTRNSPEEDSFNEVMVQVFPAFILFLAWVMTGTVEKAAALQQEMDTRGRALAQAMENIKQERQTEEGQRQADYYSAKYKAQLEELLMTWTKVSKDRPLARLLSDFNQVSNITLEVDGSCLPLRAEVHVDPADVPHDSPGIDPDAAEAVLRRGFWGLIDEAKRAFPYAESSVSNAEVIYWMEAVVYSKYSRDAVVYDPELVEPEARDFVYDPNFPAHSTVLSLKKVIHDDLVKEREKLARIQYRLVGRVCEAQYQRDLKNPIANLAVIGGTPPGTREDMLIAVLNDLEKTLYMLPEVRERIIRHRDEAATSSSSAP